MEFLSDNWEWLVMIAIPALAPVITMAVGRFGNDKVKKNWEVIRQSYRKLFFRK